MLKYIKNDGAKKNHMGIRIVSVLIFMGMAVSCEPANNGQNNKAIENTEEEPSEMTPEQFFKAFKGKPVITNGWADRANNGAGLAYANPAHLILIDDVSYPSPVDKRAAFTNAIYSGNPTDRTSSDVPAFIIVSGDIDLSDGMVSDTDHSYFDAFKPDGNREHGDIVFQIKDNKTIIGINNAKIKFGGLRIDGRRSIIIRNIVFWDAHGSTEKDTSLTGNSESKASIDALVIREGADIIPSDIWIDHCTFTDGACVDMTRNYNHDGALDIPNGKNITISWCEFTNHDKVMLVGSNDNALVATERQITLHHNYFHGVTQRMPRTRGTQMHVYNNYYHDIGVSGNSGYCMGPGRNAEFIVENNYFGFVLSGKIADYYDNAAYSAKVYSSGNNKTVKKSSYDQTSGKPWMPEYTYALDPNEGLPESVSTGAGAHLTFFTGA